MKTKRPDHSSRIHPGLDRKPGTNNWVEQQGGLPDYIERIAKHIHSDSGLSISHAIAAAVERVKVLAAKGNPQAVKALAQWEAMKARTKGKSGKKSTVKMAFARKTSHRSGVTSPLAGKNPRAKHRGSAGAAKQNAGQKASGFDESKIRRDYGGKFGDKPSSSQVLAASRIVQGAISALKIGEAVNLPAGLGWVKRNDDGTYTVQGPSGRTNVSTVSEAIGAASSVLAQKVKDTAPKKEVKK